MQQVLSLASEPGRSIRHHTTPLCGANLSTQVGLAGLAELTLPALGGVEGHHMIADFDIGYSLADGLDDSGTFVAEDNGEGTFGVLAGEGVRIC